MRIIEAVQRPSRPFSAIQRNEALLSSLSFIGFDPGNSPTRAKVAEKWQLFTLSIAYGRYRQEKKE